MDGGVVLLGEGTGGILLRGAEEVFAVHRLRMNGIADRIHAAPGLGIVLLAGGRRSLRRQRARGERPEKHQAGRGDDAIAKHDTSVTGAT